MNGPPDATAVLDVFLMGATVLGFGCAVFIFFRYWRESRDRLFGLFALAFLLLMVNRTLLVFVFGANHEERAVAPYLVRLVAFLIILAAILDKNVRRRDPRDES